MTFVEFTAVMALAEATTAKPIPKTQAEAYFRLLGDLPAEVFRVAMERAFLESKFPTLPPVGVLRSLAVEATRPQRILTSGEAWGDVMKRMANARKDETANGCVNTTTAFVGCDSFIMRAAAAFGWAALYHCVQTNQDTPRAQFMRIYEAIVAGAERQECLPTALKEDMKRLAAKPKQALNNRVAGLLGDIGKKP